MASDASRLYSRNVATLLQHLAPKGEPELDFSDEITAGACVAGASAPAPAAVEPDDAPDATEGGDAA
jgi:NAD(P) transhydrogenase subunit alpha